MGIATKNLNRGRAFQPDEIQVLAEALDEVCRELDIDQHEAAREIVAMRILDLAGHGALDSAQLRDELLGDADGVTGC